jgi:16S rRNA (cytosine967-C5)-methyltransferase
MSVSPARAVAFDLLLEMERKQSFAVDLLHSSRTEALSSRDAALCTQLVMGVLRWQSALDAEIASVANKNLDLEVRLALRLAVYQLRHLDRVPQRSAVNESVELVKRARKRSAAPLVNAVLRKLAAAEPVKSGSMAEQYAHPEWLAQRWVEQYGAAAAEAICRFDQQTPETTLRLPRAGAGELERELQSEGITLEPARLLVNARRVVQGDVPRTAAYRGGRIAIQDEGSQLVAALVGEGKRILDCCAAPGGKTAAMAERNPGAKVTAVEIHEHRLKVMRKLVRAQNVEFLPGDATQLPTPGEFDRILADVPCSGTGTIARNPEIKWRLRPEDLADLHERQVAILRAALLRLERGGRLVYSTCSLEREENEQVVEEVLAGISQIRPVPCIKVLEELKQHGELVFNDLASLCDGPYLRTIPGVHPCDGFFAAIFTRD